MSASVDQFKVLHRRQFKPPLISLNAPSLSSASHGIQDLYKLFYMFYIV